MENLLINTEFRGNHAASLQQWADDHLLKENVPFWAIKFLSKDVSDIDLYCEKLILKRLFSHKELDGSETTLEKFISVGPDKLIESIPQRSFGARILKRITDHASKITGINTLESIGERKIRQKEIHPWVEAYRKHLASIGRGKKTIAEQGNIASTFIRWLRTLRKFGIGGYSNVSLYLLKSGDVETYFVFLRRKVRNGEMAQSRACTLSTITLSFLRFCMKKFGLLNVIQGLRGIQPDENKEMWIPSPHQVAHFFENILLYSPDPILHFSLFGMIYQYGMRPQEMLNLKWEGVDFSAKTVSFVAKGGKLNEIVLIEPFYSLLLKMKAIKGGGKSFVFQMPNGKPFSNQEMSKVYITFAILSEWPVTETWVKVLRHAFITHILKETSDYLVVNRLARHSKLNTTEYYIHLLEQDYQQASMKIQKSMDLHNIIGGDFYGA